MLDMDCCHTGPRQGHAGRLDVHSHFQLHQGNVRKSQRAVALRWFRYR